MLEGKIPSQNLIKQVTVESTTSNPTFYKPIIFDALAALSALVAGYAYSRYLAGTMSISLLLLAIGMYATFFTLQVFFVQELGHRATAFLVDVLAFSAFFYRTDIIYLGIAAAILFVFSFWGAILGKMHLDNGLEIKFFKTAVAILKKFTSGMVLVLIILYLPQVSGSNFFVSKQNFQSFFSWLGGSVSNFYPSLHLDTTFVTFTEDIARLQLGNNPDFANLSAANQATDITQVGIQVAKAIENNMGGPIAADTSMSDVSYNFILGQMGSLKDHFQNWFLAVWAILVFLVVRSFGIIFYYLVSFLAFIVYQIFLAAGFVHIVGESRTHEVIVY